MATQPPQRRAPRPKGPGAQVQVRIQPQLLAAIDAWRGAQPEPPTRAEAIRRIVEQALGAKAKR